MGIVHQRAFRKQQRAVIFETLDQDNAFVVQSVARVHLMLGTR